MMFHKYDGNLKIDFKSQANSHCRPNKEIRGNIGTS